MMAQTQTEKQNMNFAGKKRSNLAFPRPGVVSIFFSFSRSYIVRVTYFFFVFVFALNPIVTSKIFLVFGTGALKRAPPFLF